MLSVNIYASMIKRAQDFIDRGEQQKAKVILETTLMEILAKICENKHLGYTQGDTLESFARLLFERQLIPEGSKKRLEELSGEFAENSRPMAGEKDLSAASSWILNFLNDYLGSQILILN